MPSSQYNLIEFKKGATVNGKHGPDTWHMALTEYADKTSVNRKLLAIFVKYFNRSLDDGNISF